MKTPAPELLAWAAEALGPALETARAQAPLSARACALLFHSAFLALEARCQKHLEMRHHCRVKAALVHVLWRSDLNLSDSQSGLDRAFGRDFTVWFRTGRTPEGVVDQRAGRSGNFGARLCDPCRKTLAGAIVDLDGDWSQAWRRMHAGEGGGPRAK